MKNERTPLLSLSVCFLKLSPARARRRERANEKKSRRRRRERARRGGSANEDRAVFFRALQSVLCFVSLLVPTEALLSPQKGSRHKKKLRKNSRKHQKKIFATVVRFKTKRRPEERRRKGERRKFFSAFSASPLFLSLQNRPRASSKPASLSLLRRANPVGSRWIPRCTFCSTGSKRKRSKGNFGSRSLLRGTRGRERVKFFSFFSLGFERRRSSRGHRRETRDKKRRKKKFELALELWRVFVGNEREEEEKINRKWRPTGPRRRAKAGNGGRGKATRIFLSGKS